MQNVITSQNVIILTFYVEIITFCEKFCRLSSGLVFILDIELLGNESFGCAKNVAYSGVAPFWDGLNRGI